MKKIQKSFLFYVLKTSAAEEIEKRYSYFYMLSVHFMLCPTSETGMLPRKNVHYKNAWRAVGLHD